MTKIELECCEGEPEYSGQCLRDRCPIYRKAKDDVNRNWPYQGTGFGNMYGNPSALHYLLRVQGNLKQQKDDKE